MGNQLGFRASLEELNLQDVGEGVEEVRKLGGGRLLKSVQCVQPPQNNLVTKVYLKKEDDPPRALDPHYKALLSAFSCKFSLRKIEIEIQKKSLFSPLAFFHFY